jgi:hypothetical protein
MQTLGKVYQVRFTDDSGNVCKRAFATRRAAVLYLNHVCLDLGYNGKLYVVYPSPEPIENSELV